MVGLTAEGDALFLHLKDAAMAFDRRRGPALSERDISQLAALLARLRDNVG